METCELIGVSEQMERIEDDVVQIDSDLTQSQRTLRSMKSVSGRFWNWISKTNPPSDIETRRESREEQLTGGSLNQSQFEVAKIRFGVFPAAVDSGLMDFLCRRAQEQRVPENFGTDEQLDALTASVRNLHAIATDMNSELGVQHRLLTNIDQDIDSLQDRFKSQCRQIQKL